MWKPLNLAAIFFLYDLYGAHNNAQHSKKHLRSVFEYTYVLRNIRLPIPAGKFCFQRRHSWSGRTHHCVGGRMSSSPRRGRIHRTRRDKKSAVGFALRDARPGTSPRR